MMTIGRGEKVSERKRVLFAPPDGHNKPSTAGHAEQPGGEFAGAFLLAFFRTMVIASGKTHQLTQ